MDAISQLQQLGFSEYEARAYAMLLQRSPLNGYELAKFSGVPRANVYAILQKLEDRGAVVRLETGTGTRYAPAAPDELLRRLGDSFQQTLRHAGATLGELARPPEHGPVWNAQGYEALTAQVLSLVQQAADRLLIAIWRPEAILLAGPLAEAEARGVEIVTLCLNACEHPCPACRGSIHTYEVVPEPGARWLIAVRDGTELIAAEIGVGGDAALVRTRQRLLVGLASGYVRHSIALAAVLKPGGHDLPESSPTSVLAALRPGHGDAGWLAQVPGWALLSEPRAGCAALAPVEDAEKADSAQRDAEIL